MSICAIVVTYYPEEDFVDNVQRYIEFVDKLIVWENTPLNAPVDFFLYRMKLEKLYGNKVVFMGTGKNEGISFALNKGLEYATNEGYSHILTMDQDSKWIDFRGYLKWARESNENEIIGPLINDQQYTDDPLDYIITSGAFFSVSLLSYISGWNEKLKIDGVDFDICFRAKYNGATIKRSPCGRLLQTYGIPMLCRYKGREIVNRVYSPRRLKSILYSHLLIIKSYSVSDEFKHGILHWWIKEKPFLILRYEKQKLCKLICMGAGIIQAICSRRLRYK